ncbi:DEAD/DEAH box helicase family protein [Lactococcus formosensis]|uniref:DEAD/DEAH box helicase family protein n=1 Tax=Lactococcus formosensis TaxID=1281486 RepID=UPI002434E56B|nr:DEAD/DEAH box helicase family protein [Lactococcus formosensis]MDG6113757.1 DEAD/DEAH box helicase family protein [Lactococcus formosensis]MDG6122252.1 DEAD/DEAH box helicase family protein [Lactococcus formosensis]MDG6151858.1 DEAD/DEAH box helicase family protein [Lactococcus formosensis]MDG6174922.1 DEAD/DEAH box helicase family protein [Lactococcus formosensis]MDG6181240.1 DEAD/DEAH box helicase family protein [Lactococcus formosensis]
MTAKVRFGNQYPTQSVILPYTETKYLEAIELYTKTKRKCYEWQHNILKDIMAVDENGLWAHQKFGYSIPRRNGKTEIVYMLELWALENGLSTLHTAHRISTSHSSYEKLKKYLEDSGYVEGEDFNSIKAKGQERLELYETGGVIQFRTRTSSGGLGEGFDFLVIDEAQEYTTEQESALKYTVTDSANPMTIMCGTPPTPVSSGTVFTHYRDNMLAGKSRYSGWAEWSVEDIKDIHDIEAWYHSNPSMGYHLNERKIEAELGEDKLDHNVQRLGYWPKYNQKSAISEREWKALKVNRLPVLKGKLFVGIKYGNDGANVAMSIAVKTLSGKIFIEAIDCQSIRNGNQWIINFLKKANVEKVVIDGQSGQGILAAEMKDFKLKAPILPTVKEIINANSRWEQGIFQKSFCHADQPSLTASATNSEKRNIGSSGGFGYKSQFDDMDICLMDSALLAHWACSNNKAKKKQQIRY